MTTYRNPSTGQEQEVGENESIRRGILERLGWKPVGAEPAKQAKPVEAAKPETTTEEPQKLPSHGQPPAKNVPAKKEEGTK